MRDRVVTTHIHDNHGEKDEHLLPYEGTIDWDAALDAIANAPEPLPLVLELKEQAPGSALASIRFAPSFDKLEKHLDEKGRTPRMRSHRTHESARTRNPRQSIAIEHAAEHAGASSPFAAGSTTCANPASSFSRFFATAPASCRASSR